MQTRDPITADAVAQIATLLAHAYRQYQHARRLDRRRLKGEKGVNGELANSPPESLHGHEVDA
jgi:hypothetical protein